MTYTWSQTTASLPSQISNKDGIAAVVLNNKMYALGGWSSGAGYGVSNNNVLSTTDGITFTPSTKTPTWSGRHAFPAVVHDGRIYVLGGDQNSEEGYVADMHSWNGVEAAGSENEWVEHPTPPWGVRAGHVAFSLGGFLYVGFGQTHTWFGDTPTVFYTDLWRWDGTTWELVSDEMPITPRGYFANALPLLDGEAYFICGSSYETSDVAGRDYQNDVFAMGATGKVRQVLHKKASNLPLTMYHNVVAFDNKLWILGGYTGSDQQTWYMSDDKGKTWTQQATPPWGARHAAMCAVFNNAIYFGTGLGKSDMWKLTKDTTPAPPPSGVHYGSTPTTTTSFASQWTVFDPVNTVSAGDVIDKIGLHKANSGSVIPKIARIVSGQTLEVVYSGSSVTHNGGGYQDFDITDFTVPNDGKTYMVGFAFADSGMSFATSGSRYMKLGDVTGSASYAHYTDGSICTSWTEV